MLLAVAATVVVQVNEWAPLDRIIAVALIGLLLAYLWSWGSLRRVGVARSVASDRVQVGQTLVDRLTLRNRALLPKLWLELFDHSSLPGHSASRVVTVGGNRSTEWTSRTLCVRRGRYQVGPVSLRSGDPFGVFPRRRRMRGAIDVVVYPAHFDVGGFRLPASPISGGPHADLRTQTPTPMVTGIREYVDGDAFNRISWSASARLGRLMVKEFDVDPTSDLWLVLDLDARHKSVARDAFVERADSDLKSVERWLDSTEEYAVAAVTSIARYALDQGRAVGMIATGAHYEVIQAERSDRAYMKILESLAVLRSDGQRPLAEVLVAESRRFTRNSGLVVVSSSTEPAWVDALTLIALRRVQTTVVFVDGGSFEPYGASDPAQVLDQLVKNRIRTYVVRSGDRLADALRKPIA